MLKYKLMVSGNETKRTEEVKGRSYRILVAKNSVACSRHELGGIRGMN